MDSLAAKLAVFLVSIGATGAASVLSDWPPAYTALVLLMALDIVTGVMCGFKGHRASSNTLKGGVKEKVGIAVAVGVIHVLGAIGIPDAVAILAVYGFIATESLSVIENLAQLGVPVPDAIRRRLEQLRTTSVPMEATDPAERPTSSSDDTASPQTGD
jgi:toxin secretion/phage lysis holin